MGSLPRVSVVPGARVPVPAAPLTEHLARMGGVDRTALVYSDETCNVRVSFAELEGRTNAMARAIAAHARPTGPNRDQDYVIAVCMQPTHKYVRHSPEKEHWRGIPRIGTVQLAKLLSFPYIS